MANYKERRRSKNNKQSTEIQEERPSQDKKAKQFYRIKRLVKKGKEEN
jgi:hypothetical protein